MGAFISADERRLLEPPKQLYRFTEADDRSGDSAARTSIGPNPIEASKTPIWRGTEISNPFSSSGESSTNRSRGVRGPYLQNPENRREILADDKLRRVFGKDKVTMFEMNKHLDSHLKRAYRRYPKRGKVRAMRLLAWNIRQGGGSWLPQIADALKRRYVSIAERSAKGGSGSDEHTVAAGRGDKRRVMTPISWFFPNIAGARRHPGFVQPCTVWGNTPQTYSMAGIINSAMRLSVRWEEDV